MTSAVNCGAFCECFSIRTRAPRDEMERAGQMDQASGEEEGKQLLPRTHVRACRTDQSAGSLGPRKRGRGRRGRPARAPPGQRAPRRSARAGGQPPEKRPPAALPGDFPAPPSNNTIQKDHMRDNDPDCYDDTTGTGTAGTANTWLRNNGETENRPGLCKKGQ